MTVAKPAATPAKKDTETAELTPKSGGKGTPLLSAYLASLPEGLDSFPQVQQKGSIVQSFLDGVPIQTHLSSLPGPLADWVKHPPLASAWVSEVKGFALMLACADLCFPTTDAWGGVRLPGQQEDHRGAHLRDVVSGARRQAHRQRGRGPVGPVPPRHLARAEPQRILRVQGLLPT